jgi:hypothetical protein
MKRGTFPVDVSSIEYRTFVQLGPDPDVEAFMRVVCGEHGLSLQVDGRSYDSQQIIGHVTLRTRLGLQIYRVVQELYATAHGDMRR